MTTLPLSDIIRDAFKLAWRYKYLWLFGFFVGSAAFNIPTGNQSSGPQQLEDLKAWVLAALAMILIIGFFAVVIFLILHSISKTALIYNVYQIETGGAHSLSGGWDFGLKCFWPMLGLTVSEWVVVVGFIIMLVLLEVVIFAASTVLGLLSLLPAIPIFFAGIAVVVLTWGYAERFVVLENRGVVESIGDGWTLFRAEWKTTLAMGLIKLAIAIAVGIGMMGIGLLLVTPAIALWLVSKVLAVLYGIAVLAPFIALISAYMGTFDSAVWTKVFLGLRAAAYAHGSAPPAIPSSTPPSAPPPSSTPPPPLFE
jgi:hypothetical protein